MSRPEERRSASDCIVESFYLLGVANNNHGSVRGHLMTREAPAVQGQALSRLTVHQLPLLVEPALGLVFPLQHDMVALEPACEVVPGRGDHRILALEVLDDLLVGSLERLEYQCPGTSVIRGRHMKEKRARKPEGHIRDRM